MMEAIKERTKKLAGKGKVGGKGTENEYSTVYSDKKK